MLTNLAWLYVTHDGGSTWRQQTLPLPQGIPPAQLLIQPPTFFSATDGLLPVRFSDLTTSKGIATVIYVTHDGGTTWSSTIPVSAALSASHFLDILELNEVRHGVPFACFGLRRRPWRGGQYFLLMSGVQVMTLPSQSATRKKLWATLAEAAFSPTRTLTR